MFHGKTIFWRKHMIAWGIIMYSDGQLLRTSFGKKSENRHSGDVLSMGFKKSS